MSGNDWAKDDGSTLALAAGILAAEKERPNILDGYNAGDREDIYDGCQILHTLLNDDIPITTRYDSQFIQLLNQLNGFEYIIIGLVLKKIVVTGSDEDIASFSSIISNHYNHDDSTPVYCIDYPTLVSNKDTIEKNIQSIFNHIRSSDYNKWMCTLYAHAGLYEDAMRWFKEYDDNFAGLMISECLLGGHLNLAERFCKEKNINAVKIITDDNFPLYCAWYDPSPKNITSIKVGLEYLLRNEDSYPALADYLRSIIHCPIIARQLDTQGIFKYIVDKAPNNDTQKSIIYNIINGFIETHSLDLAKKYYEAYEASLDPSYKLLARLLKSRIQQLEAAIAKIPETE